ncbi:MAG: NrfD/PsrC family molybdoenzyme membrane anchor subunit [Sporomusaceae bacterium]|nr:NrfD/PsrC family molybdoenzyme membrane anchor subunit [Sporomusaceae bacterium]
MTLTVQTTWGHLVAWYLFLAGMGAGLYIIAIGAKIWRGSTAYEKAGYYLSPALVILGSFLLLLDLGQPLRAALAILRPHSSMISVGTLILSLFIAVGLLQGYLLYRGRRLAAFWDWAGLLLAVGAATYTGLLLGVVKAIPFWNNPLLPVLFLVSAVSSGAGLLMLLPARGPLAAGEGGDILLPQLLRLDTGLIIVKAGLLATLILIAKTGGLAAAASAAILLSGFFALPFWGLVVVAGLVIPLALELRGQAHAPRGRLAAGLCLLAGALALRYSVVVAGVWLPLGG